MKEFDKKLFWDVDVKKLDKKQHKDFIIARVLETGDLPDVKWLLKNYSKNNIKQVVVKSRRISPKTANFWRQKLNIKQPILCIKKPFHQKLKMLWPH